MSHCRCRFDKDFFMDLIFRAAVDEKGEDIAGSVDSAFWERVSKRAVRAAPSTD
jgi:hypothetical protein